MSGTQLQGSLLSQYAAIHRSSIGAFMILSRDTKIFRWCICKKLIPGHKIQKVKKSKYRTYVICYVQIKSYDSY